MPSVFRELPAGSKFPTSVFLEFHFLKLSIRRLKFVTL